MPIPAHIARKLREVLGAEAGDDLVTWMEDTSTARADLAELKHATETGFLRLEAQVAAHAEQLTAKLERARADLITWSFVFWVGAVGAIAALAGVLRN